MMFAVQIQEAMPNASCQETDDTISLCLFGQGMNWDKQPGKLLTSPNSLH